MGLNNAQYNRILMEYDECRNRNHRLLRKREDEVYQKIPGYRQMENDFASLSIAAARRRLMEEDSEASDYYIEAGKMRQQKRELLKRYGYPENYLDEIYDCPDCKDTGYIGSEKCHCFKQAIVNILYEQANLGNILKEENFQNFRLEFYDEETEDEVLKITPRENMERVLMECYAFVDDFGKAYENILLYGNTGVGKTFLTHCIARELLNRAFTVVYLTAFELFDILEKNKFQKNGGDKAQIEERAHYILNCDLLIVDDLGTELVNSFSASQLYLCVNERHLRQRSTVISTNLSLDDIGALYSERVFSRVISEYKLLKIIGGDIRVKKAFQNESHS